MAGRPVALNLHQGQSDQAAFVLADGWVCSYKIQGDGSRQIVDFQSQISFFRAVYDDYDNYLDPQSLKIWHEVEECWQTRDRLEGLDTKMLQTEKIYDRIMRDLGNLHNKRLTMFVLIFTVLSMLSVIVDTVDFTQGGELSPPSMLRLALLGMMALTVVLLAHMLSKSKN